MGGADLFESYAGSIIAAATLGVQAPSILTPHSNAVVNPYAYICLPFWLAGAGILTSILGFFFVSTKQEGKGWNVKLSSLMWALEKGMYLAAVSFIVLSAVLIYLLYGSAEEGWKIYGCIIIGLVAGAAI